MFSASNFIIGGSAQSMSFGFYSNFNTGIINAGGPYGITNQSGNAIAIGNNAAQYNQFGNTVAIGQNAGQYSQGNNAIAIAIGNNAGITSQHWNSIILNASGNVISSNNNYACYINPIQNRDSSANYLLTYNPSSSEVNYNSRFRFIPWTDCGYTVVAGNTFGELITNSTSTAAPTPATGSTTTYKYSVIGNTMFLQFTYSNSSSNVGTSGTTPGVYLYNLPKGYTINTSAVTAAIDVSDTTNRKPFGTLLGSAAVEFLYPYTNPAFSYSCYVYCASATTLCIFVPSYYQLSSDHLAWWWHGRYLFNYAVNNNHYSFNACFPIN